MKSSEEKKPRFTFFKKNKKAAELSVDSEKSDNESNQSGGFNRRTKIFNPFKSVRKAVNKYRTTRRPAPEVAVPPPVIIEPEPIDPANLEEVRQEVCVVEDIRKNRPKGPQGRKRRSMRPVSTADGSQSGTPVVAQLEDMLNGNTASRSNSVVNGNSLTVDHVKCKSVSESVSENGGGHDPPESDLMKSDVGNLASSSQETGNTGQGNAESSKECKKECAEKDISVEGASCISGLGDLSNISTGEES